MSKPLWVSLILLLLAPAAFAHKPSDSYLRVTVTDTAIAGQWDIALRDLDYAIGVDNNDDGAITWAELRERHAAITAYAFSRFQVASGNAPCRLEPTSPPLVDQHTDGAYTVVPFSIHCVRITNSLTLTYQLFFDLDPQHRGLLHVDYPGSAHTAIFSPSQKTQVLELHNTHAGMEFLQYLREGVWHIWIGYDHILFLLSLLLPTVLKRYGRQWRAVEDFRLAFVDVVKVITAFTLAHSITLSLAALQVISLPSRWVESAIAVSVIVAALNNLFPLIIERRWLVAFGFGLIHGFGFATVLSDLGLPQGTLLLALVGFNLGVEVGQLAIVSVFLPFAYWAREFWWYRKLAVSMGSVLIVLLAGIWLLERSLNLNLLGM